MDAKFVSGTLVSAFLLFAAVSCDGGSDEIIDEPQQEQNIQNEDADTPDFDYVITPYDGETAGDATNDVVGTDEDIFWEANDFTNTVTVTYEGTSASVTSSSDKILTYVSGADVAIDMATNEVKNTEIIVSGKSDDGQLKIYGVKKFKLTLAGVELTSLKGPAINDQCKKRVFVHLQEGTTNRLTDTDEYTGEAYYLVPEEASDEDRKGCFFSEGNIIMSGTGVLVVEGKQKHGIATDGYFYMRPGVTVAVTDAAKNCIHVKGDEDDNIGVIIKGGLIHATTSATAGKGIKTDLHVQVDGGKLCLNTTGGSEYDEDESDTSSPAGLKTDGNVVINDGTLILKSTGEGGKGMNIDSTLTVNGGEITVTTTGGKYIYNEALDLTSSPKGIKADGNIAITGGEINISVTGQSDGSEGLESKTAISISGGETYVYAYDDAMNASNDITVSGGRVYCYSVSNDGIDSNGTLNFSGGLTIASGATAPEEAFDCDQSQNFRIEGGTLIGIGSTAVSPSTSSSQRTVIYNGLSAAKDAFMGILDSDDKPIMIFKLPRSLNGGTLFFSSPDLVSGSYSVVSGGSVSGASDNWNGWYDGASWSGGSVLGTFTSNSTVTTAGSTSGGGGGGFGPGNGGGGGGRP